MFFVPPRETHKSDPEGVRFDSFKTESNQNQNKININYIDIDIKNKGVRNDNKPHYHISKQNENCLHYRRPCLCGSLQHQRTNNIQCLLNPNYLD